MKRIALLAFGLYAGFALAQAPQDRPSSGTDHSPAEVAESATNDEEQAAEQHDAADDVPEPAVLLPEAPTENALLNDKIPAPESYDGKGASRRAVHAQAGTFPAEQAAQRPLFTDWVLAICAALAVFISALTLYLLKKTAEYARKTWDAAKEANTLHGEALELAKSNSETAARSAEAAWKSADVAIQMANADRAWLVIDFDQAGRPQEIMTNIPSGGLEQLQSSTASFSLHNYGGSPALLKSIVADVFWMPESCSIDNPPAPDSAEAKQHRCKAQCRIKFYNASNTTVEIQINPNTNDVDNSIASLFGRSIAVKEHQTIRIRANYKWPENYTPDVASVGYFYCVISYEDIRGRQGETSHFIRLTELGKGMDLSNKELSRTYNYRK